MNTGSRRASRAIAAWLLLGLLSFALLPWYLSADASLLQSLPGIFGAADTASGAVQAARHGRPWLWLGLAGLAPAILAWRMRAGVAQGRVLLFGAVLGVAGLSLSGFAIGAQGWSFAWLEPALGKLAVGQGGIGLGGALTLLALLMLLGAGLARLGYFRGDAFVAGAVVGCAALLLLFIALPVLKAPSALPRRAGSTVALACSSRSSSRSRPSPS